MMPEVQPMLASSSRVFSAMSGSGVAGPELYERNAFRLTGVPITSTARDISRFAERLELQRRLGASASAPTHPAFPLSKVATPDDIREALIRLRDPEQRLLDEFFWFWPLTWEDPSHDDATAALSRGDAARAAMLWNGMLSDPEESSVALHNLAVLEHLRALEQPSAPEARRPANESDLWAQAYSYWRRVVADDGVWRVLARRVDAVNDPTLTVAVVRDLRSALPGSLLAVNASLARRAASSGHLADASHQSAAIRKSGLDAHLIERCIRRLLEPEATTLETLVGTALSSARADATNGLAAAQTLLAQSRVPLNVVDALLPCNHQRREELRDRVASASLSCLVSYANATEDWERAIPLTRETGQVAASPALCARIAQNLETAENNHRLACCWFCKARRADPRSVHRVAMYGDVTRESQFLGRTRVQWRQHSVEVPRCSECRTAHERVSNLTALGGMVGAVLGIVSCNGMGDGGVFGIVLFAICIAAGMFLGNRIAWAQAPNGSARVATGREFPPIKDLQRAGWQFGQKPPNVS